MTILNVFGGLAIFIFGMKMMSDGLHAAAGNRMRSILRFFASNRFVAILSGTMVTAVIQSSSASTVMVIGFVNAGLLNLTQSIGIIFGANIGTTVTAQLVAFKVEWLIMPAIIIGLLMLFVSKPAVRGWGETIIGFGFLFLGMGIMSKELEVLAANPSFTAAFRTFDCAPVEGWMPVGALLGAVGIGLAATMVIQSSSACTGVIIALGASGLLNLHTAVALTLGSNIGTTVTAQLAAIPANRIAKQTALAHTLFNVIGVLIVGTSFFWLPSDQPGTPLFFRLVNALSGGSDLPRQIANAHTLFNVATTLLLVPFVPQFARVCEKLIPAEKRQVRYQYLEPHLLGAPAIAFDQAKNGLRMMFEKAWGMTEAAIRDHFIAETGDAADVPRLKECEVVVDRFQMEITEYLSKLSSRELPLPLAGAIPQVIHCVNDAERIADHGENILDLSVRLETSEGRLSPVAREELEQLFKLLQEQAAAAFAALKGCDPAAVETASRLEKEIRFLAEQFESNHIARLGAGECSPLIGITYVEMLSEFRDITRHVANITDRSLSVNRV